MTGSSQPLMLSTVFLRAAMLVLAIGGQVIGASLLPATAGFTRPLATIGCLGAFAVAMFGMARLIVSGMNLSIVVPLMACTVPLAILAIALLFLGETASPLRIGLLVVATIIIGTASTMA